MTTSDACSPSASALDSWRSADTSRSAVDRLSWLCGSDDLLQSRHPRTGSSEFLRQFEVGDRLLGAPQLEQREYHGVSPVGVSRVVGQQLAEGRRLVEQAIDGARAKKAADQKALTDLSEALDAADDDDARLKLIMAKDVAALFTRAGPRTHLTRYDKTLTIWVDRPKAVFSAWYELMPRSQSGDPNRHSNGPIGYR